VPRRQFENRSRACPWAERSEADTVSDVLLMVALPTNRLDEETDDRARPSL
jgi:hypothetical protein